MLKSTALLCELVPRLWGATERTPAARVAPTVHVQKQRPPHSPVHDHRHDSGDVFARRLRSDAVPY